MNAFGIDEETSKRIVALMRHLAPTEGDGWNHRISIIDGQVKIWATRDQVTDPVTLPIDEWRELLHATPPHPAQTAGCTPPNTRVSSTVTRRVSRKVEDR